MSKPSDIPQDVWTLAGPLAVKAAETALRNLEDEDLRIELDAIRTAVARAILSERNNAADFLEANQTIINGESADPNMPDLIQAIRNGGK